MRFQNERERERERNERLNTREARIQARGIEEGGKAMVVEWLCPGLRPTRSNRPRLLHCKVILLDEHELLQDVLVSARPSLDSERSRSALFLDRRSPSILAASPPYDGLFRPRDAQLLNHSCSRLFSNLESSSETLPYLSYTLLLIASHLNFKSRAISSSDEFSTCLSKTRAEIASRRRRGDAA